MRVAQPRCGRIAYVNVLPVYAAFDMERVGMPGSMTAAPPADLNRDLLAGRLDISPVSSALYPAHADSLLLAPGLCLASPGTVRSILCLTPGPLTRLRGRPIAVTADSLTARTLLQIICRLYLNFDPQLVTSPDPLAEYIANGTPALLIGDAALAAAQRVPHEVCHDLGSLWKDLTGHGMVYALWAVREEYHRAEETRSLVVLDALERSLAWGLAHMDDVIRLAQAYASRSASFYREYYAGLRFQMGDGQLRDLSAFYEHGAKAGVFAEVPALRFAGRVVENV